MTQYVIAKATEISGIIEENISDLIGKLCEQEPREVRDLVWNLVGTRMAFLTGRGECFVLPPLDEL